MVKNKRGEMAGVRENSSRHGNYFRRERGRRERERRKKREREELLSRARKGEERHVPLLPILLARRDKDREKVRGERENVGREGERRQ